MEREPEPYKKAYIAIPVTESPLLSWVKSKNPNKHFVHMTVFYTGGVDDNILPEVKESISVNSQKLKGAVLQPARLEIIGEDDKYFIIRVEGKDAFYKVRENFERDFPNFNQKNYPFLPHISIHKLGFVELSRRERIQLLSCNWEVRNIDPMPVESLGLFYRTEGGDTAVLFSQKI